MLDIEIEQRAIKVGYMQAIIDFCEEKEIYDYEDVTEQLSDVLINKIKLEARKKNYFPDKKIKIINNVFDDQESLMDKWFERVVCIIIVIMVLSIGYLVISNIINNNKSPSMNGNTNLLRETQGETNGKHNRQI